MGETARKNFDNFTTFVVILVTIFVIIFIIFPLYALKQDRDKFDEYTRVYEAGMLEYEREFSSLFKQEIHLF